MIDASIVQAPKQSLSKDEKALVTEGAMAITWSPPKRRQKDTAAYGTKKHDKSYFGYKVSATADKGYVDGEREERLAKKSWWQGHERQAHLQNAAAT